MSFIDNNDCENDRQVEINGTSAIALGLLTIAALPSAICALGTFIVGPLVVAAAIKKLSH
jgi:hypothetical protein